MNMICKLCGQDVIESVKIKKGYICRDCFEKFPYSFQNSINKLTLKDLREASDNFIRITANKIWARIKNFGVGDSVIHIDHVEYPLKAIKKIYLNFHPLRQGGSENKAYGTLTVVLITDEPRMRIEEPLLKTELQYYICGKNISYVFPPTINQLIKNIQSVIDDETYDTSVFKPKKEEAEKARRAKEKEQSMNREKKSEFLLAKELYDVEIPYTKDDIISKKRELLKKYHPDNGGTAEQAAQINKAYDLLAKFAS